MNNNEFVVDICIYWDDRCACSRVSDFHCMNVDEILNKIDSMDVGGYGTKDGKDFAFTTAQTGI